VPGVAYVADVAVIEVEELTRTYRSRTGILRRRAAIVQALRGVSFSVERGELFGLLGPNGAGKTTMIKVLTTLLLPTSGSARVLGYDVRRDARRIRGRIGYVFGGERGLYDRLSALDNLRYFADLYRVPASKRSARIDALLALVELKGRERERVETYSRGMKQRLHIARGLLHDPEILFLDEPTIGLDPLGARELRQTIAGLHQAGKTIVLTTHYMFEADTLCQRIAVIANGSFVATGTPSDLKAVVGDHTIVEIETFGIADGPLERLREIPGVRSVAVETREQAQVLLVQSAVGADVVRALLNELAGTETGKVVTREPTLEDAYVELVKSA
jgi:ABC-2 type transport system ATP-binding protein